MRSVHLKIAAYQLAAIFKWTDLIYTHFSARLPGSEDFLINPYGLMFDEITASNLVKIDAQGKVLDVDAGKMLHWSNRLASEGRGKGIALLAASQRPQKVHKDFLTSCETLIAMRVIHAAPSGGLFCATQVPA